MLKKLFIALTIINLLLTGYNALAAGSSAENAAQELAQGSPIQSPSDIFKILAKILQYTYTIFFIVAIIFVLAAAFTYLIAKDDPEKIKGATRQIMWAAVAIAVALISVGAAQIIKGFISP